MVFVHAFAGGIVANLAIRNKSLTDKQKSIVYALGIIGGILPDIDLTLLVLKIAEQHRLFITHSAPIYTLALLIWLFMNRKNEFLKFSGIIFYLGILSHLFLDFMTGGLVLLAPFTYAVYGLPLPVTHTRIEWARMYLLSPLYMVGEVLVAGLYLQLIRGEPNRIAKVLPWLFLLLAALMVLLLTLF